VRTIKPNQNTKQTRKGLTKLEEKKTMCRIEPKTRRSVGRASLGAALAALVALTANQANAQGSPPGCNANALSITIAKNPGGNIVLGTVVHYTIVIQNPVTDPGGNPACDISLPNGLSFICPGADGLPDGTTTVIRPNGFVIHAGDPAISTNIDCTITGAAIPAGSPPGTLPQAQAKVSAPGAILDDGFNDPANIDKTISVSVVTPCIGVTKNCVNTCTPYGQPIQFSGVVSNCGNILLLNVTVTDDQNGGVLVFSTNALQPGASAPYSGSYTNSGAILCGPFTDTVTAIGTANTAPTPVNVTNTASATCHVSTSPAITLLKDCGKVTGGVLDVTTKTLSIGDQYADVFSVTNTGNVPLTDIVITDSLHGTIPVPDLAPGTGTSITNGPFTVGQPVTLADCTISDSATVNATNICPADATCPSPAFASAGPAMCTLTVVTHPSLAVTKICGPATVQFNTPYQVSGTVTNTGDANLSNVTVTDVITDPNGNKTTNTVATIGPLAVGGSVGIGPITITPSVCGPYADQFTATASGVCQSPSAATSAVCTTTNLCPPPCVQIFKQVVCSPGAPTNCNPALFSLDLTQDKSATGVAGANGDACFCYQITITNCGSQMLTNVVVMDNKLTLMVGSFPTSLDIGGVASAVVQACWPVGSVTNVVTVSGNGNLTGQSVSSTNSAVATVLPIGVNCSILLFAPAIDMDGNTNDNHLTIAPSDAPGTISSGFVLTICNSGSNTVDVTLGETFAGDVSLTNCNWVDANGNIVAALPGLDAGPLTVGACTNIVCDILLGTNTCPGPDTITVSVFGTAVATATAPCIYTTNGTPVVTATNNCNGTIQCVTPTTCRTTGGGTMFNCDTNPDCVVVTTVLFPVTNTAGILLDHVSHGGQLGAPYAHQDCSQILADPCIRGQWQHSRHYVGSGNPRDNYAADFHSNTPKGIFDTLLCACLGCCGTNTKHGPNGGFQGLANLKFAVCNPDDHRVCGPMPSPAPANALIFSGIGTVQPATDNGPGKTENWVVFRVYVEDRSEPGGGHPKGSVNPADVYVFQAWDTGISVLKKADPNSLPSSGPLGDVNAFRAQLSADSCAFLQGVSVNGPFLPGTLPSPVVLGISASVNDSGTLRNGNQQIHPDTGAVCTATGGIQITPVAPEQVVAAPPATCPPQ
jgi:hypothetical protein